LQHPALEVYRMVRTRLLIRHALRLALLGGAALLSVASGDAQGGDRANGGCPEGETCSPDTPDGLYFGGAVLGDSYLPVVTAPERIALGGSETISVFRDENATSEFTGWTAVSSGPSLVVGDMAGNSVVITAAAPGADYLRILDPRNLELYDRVELTTAAIARVALVPPKLDLVGDRELFDDPSPAVVYKASRVSNRFVVALYDAADVRLVDESLSVQPGTGFASGASWDGLRQTQALPAGTYDLDVGFGSGDSGTLSVTLVDRADTVVWVEGHDANQRLSPANGLVFGTIGHYCFRAENGGRPMIGESYEFSGSGVLGVTEHGEGCVDVQPTAPGLGTLLVTAGDGSVSFDITVAAAKQATARKSNGPLEGTPLPALTAAAQPGERAEAQAP
jgi:hypothetical protein